MAGWPGITMLGRTAKWQFAGVMELAALILEKLHNSRWRKKRARSRMQSNNTMPMQPS